MAMAVGPEAIGPERAGDRQVMCAFVPLSGTKAHMTVE